VLDVDTKRPEANGYDTLDALGFAILRETPMVHTASGGLYIYFAPANSVEIGCTKGEKGRGTGRGLDWPGVGGYVIVPSTGSGYEWDPHWNFDTVGLAPVPAALLPRDPERPAAIASPVESTTGLSPYAEAALDSACRRIIAAPAGQQEATLNSECFSIGTLAGSDAIPMGFAHRILLWAARQVTDHDRRRPWRARDLENKVARAFEAGTRHPRNAQGA
jgi:Bifunctional DNA primase/polymerase, N-terminal